MEGADLVIAGGGLAGGLLALAMARRRPAPQVTIVEAGPQVRHYWSFFESDLTPEGQALVAPLVACRWPETAVSFPALKRTLPGCYQTIPSERLDAAVRALPQTRVVEGRVVALDAAGVTLADGRRLPARAVVDARGGGAFPGLRLKAQKFLGLLLQFEAPHGILHPVIMDACVPQEGGYRFLYLLPFDRHRCLVEDTCYADDAALAVDEVRARILAYAKARGLPAATILQEEEGILPVALGGDMERYMKSLAEGVAPVGLRAALFHPLTGYSLPHAVATALRLAGLPEISSPSLAREMQMQIRSTWNNGRFYRLLARMLFEAAVPPERWRVLQRFYGLDAGLIARFYAGRSTFRDRLRLLSGRPPVPLMRALRVLYG